LVSPNFLLLKLLLSKYQFKAPAAARKEKKLYLYLGEEASCDWLLTSSAFVAAHYFLLISCRSFQKNGRAWKLFRNSSSHFNNQKIFVDDMVNLCKCSITASWIKYVTSHVM